MEYLFGFLILACLLILVVGLVKPGTVMPWSAAPNRGQVLLIYGIALIASIVLFGVFAPKPTEAQLAASERQAEAERQDAAATTAFEREQEAADRETERALKLAAAERESRADSISQASSSAPPETQVEEQTQPSTVERATVSAAPEPVFDGITNQEFQEIRRQMRGSMTDLQFSALQRSLVGRPVRLRGKVQDVNEDGSISIDLDRTGLSAADVILLGVSRNVGVGFSRRQSIEFEGSIREVQRLAGSLTLYVQANGIPQ